jgi:hypothetical protein
VSEPSPSPQVPLSIEPIFGWRAWRLRAVDGELRLISLTREDRWPAGEPMRARCSGHTGAGVPSIRCTCGIYATNSPADLAGTSVFTGEPCVVGAIAMWGTVVEHASGARSEIAYPARLHLVCAVCLHEGRGGVQPAVVVDSGSAVRALCRRHSFGRSGTSRPARQVQQELLSTYGVEVMPLERVARPLRRRRIRRAVGPEEVLRGLVRVVFATIGFLFQAYIVLGLLIGAVTIGFVVVGNVVQTFVHADPSSVPLASTAPTQATEQSGVGFRTSREAPPPKVSVDPVPLFAAVCGAPVGGSVRIVRCGSGPEDLLGLAQGGRPRGSMSDCAPGWDAYSRGPHYWICWIVLPGVADVPRRPTSDYPFERTNEGG